MPWNLLNPISRNKWNRYQRHWLRGYRYVQSLNRPKPEYSSLALSLGIDKEYSPEVYYGMKTKNKGGRPRIQD